MFDRDYWPYSNWRDEDWEEEAERHLGDDKFEPEKELKFDES